VHGGDHNVALENPITKRHLGIVDVFLNNSARFIEASTYDSEIPDTTTMVQVERVVSDDGEAVLEFKAGERHTDFILSHSAGTVYRQGH
jgi:hypothetical protein